MSQHCGFTPKKPEILCFFKIGSQIQWLNIMNSHIIICSPYFLMKISCLGQFGPISHFWTTPIRFFHPKIPTSSQGHSSGCDATSSRGQAVRRLHHRLPALRRGRQWSSGGMSAHHTCGGSLNVGSPSHLAFNSKSRSHLDLVGGLEHLDYFSFHIWDVILPIDELHHFSRW